MQKHKQPTTNPHAIFPSRLQASPPKSQVQWNQKGRARETDECRSETKLHQDLTPPLLHLLFPINKCVRERGAAIKRPTKTKTKEPNQHTQHNTTQATPPHPTTTPSFDLHPRSPNLSSLRPLSAPLDPPMRIRRRPPGQPLAYLLPSDPSAAPQSPPRASSIDRQERPPPPPGGKQGEGELHLHPATNDSPAPADLEDGRSRSSALRRPALLPQVRALHLHLLIVIPIRVCTHSQTREGIR
jgi:hypothetical protein